MHFHWDRYSKKDDKSSCWIRVSQNWGGKGWGGMFIPHVGQEVIVQFLEGDPDMPIITGRVYNAENMPPVELPAGQDAEHHSRSRRQRDPHGRRRRQPADHDVFAARGNLVQHRRTQTVATGRDVNDSHAYENLRLTRSALHAGGRVGVVPIVPGHRGDMGTLFSLDHALRGAGLEVDSCHILV